MFKGLSDKRAVFKGRVFKGPVIKRPSSAPGESRTARIKILIFALKTDFSLPESDMI